MTDEELKPVVEVPEGEQPAVTIDTDRPAAPVAAPKADAPIPAQKAGESDAQYAAQLKTLQNQLNGARRINETLNQRLAQVEARLTQVAPKPATPPNDYQKLVDDGNWQEAVAKLADERAEKKLSEYKASQEAQKQVEVIDNIFLESANYAISKYPQLDVEKGNAEDPFSQVFLEVSNAHPEWNRNPYGPRLVLQEAERLAEERGIHASKSQRSSSPQRRGSTALPPSRSGVNGAQVVLSKDQVEFAKANGLSPEAYAKTIREISERGSVEIS